MTARSSDRPISDALNLPVVAAILRVAVKEPCPALLRRVCYGLAGGGISNGFDTATGARASRQRGENSVFK